jgi:N-formylglutamate amidohydrolase
VESPTVFIEHNHTLISSPLVVAVPHAGRYYPPELWQAAAVSRSQLEMIEDRYADLLVSGIIGQGHYTIIAKQARAWLDLNRDPRELDPSLLVDPPPPDLLLSPRVSGGLGLIPTRLGHNGQLWQRRFSLAEINARITQLHQPYHQAIAAALSARHAHFGYALLLDCHSMPPLPREPGQPTPRIIIGDRHGLTATSATVTKLLRQIAASGFAVACNQPYAGAYSIARHSSRSRQIEAIQLEVDRTLYLDARLREPGPGLSRIVVLLTKLADMISEVPGVSLPIAAE